MLAATLFSVLAILASYATAGPTPVHHVSIRTPRNIHAQGVTNVHLEWSQGPRDDADIIVLYGSCDQSHPSEAHHEVGRFLARSYPELPSRLVWVMPEDLPAEGCLHLYQEVQLLGRSEPLRARSKPMKKRSTLSEINNPYGAWFDGVEYLKSKNQTASFVAGKKDQQIGIVGGGMAGLMSGLLLDQVGIHTWEISESSQRIGGRLRTAYLNGTQPEDYQYQEMGPMRFPVSLTYSETNETLPIKDHQLVFQLADVLNQMNSKLDPWWQVNFIPWIQSNPQTYQYQGGVRNPDGTTPRRSEYTGLVAEAESGTTHNSAADAAETQLEDFVGYDNKSRLAASNLFKAHKQAVEDGLMDFSESSFLRAQGLGWNETSAVGGTGTLWDDIYDTVYFSAGEWRTIDKGLNRLAEAFHPIVDNRLEYGRRIEQLSYNETTGKTGIAWREDGDLKTKSYDKTLVAVPFSVARMWRTPALNPVMTEAIKGLGYDYACKVSLLYKTRFWEHIDNPIYGGCGTTDLPGIGSFCYPAYNINGTGPGVILAAYSTGDGLSAQAMSEQRHVQLVVDAMNEIHGALAAEQYTGVYARQCWGLDENHAGSWAAPYTGQHERYMPEYHKTHANHIFIGEHTSINHAWIFSALESSVRGVVQLLLDDGLVDEAQEIVEKWMARWISV